jgi:hypothetical protein
LKCENKVNFGVFQLQEFEKLRLKYSPDFNDCLQLVAKSKEGCLSVCLLTYLVYSQIWLNLPNA